MDGCIEGEEGVVVHLWKIAIDLLLAGTCKGCPYG